MIKKMTITVQGWVCFVILRVHKGGAAQQRPCLVSVGEKQQSGEAEGFSSVFENNSSARRCFLNLQ